MRVGTALISGAAAAVCAIDSTYALRINDIAEEFHSVDDVIDGGPAAMTRLATALAEAGTRPGLQRLRIDGLSWCVPLSRPKTMFCVALNNTMADPTLLYRPAHCAYFTKPTAALVGSGQPIEIRPHYGLTHCEPELGLVIGRKGRDIAEADALSHVFGYTIVNDVTSVGMRKEDRFHGGYPTRSGDGSVQFVEEQLTYPARYKGCDTFGPIGPWLTTPDEFSDPGDVRIQCWLDDEEIFDDRTSNLHFSVAKAISWISAHSTLYPGDILSMGTAGHPDQTSKPLSYGDLSRRGAKVRIAIEGLGSLESPVHRIDAPDPRLAFPPVTDLGALLRRHGLTKAA